VTEERKGRGRPPQVPPTPREPIGRERAVRSGGPRRSAPKTSVPDRPDLMVEPEFELPRKVRKEIERLVTNTSRAKDVILCLAVGTAASEDEEHAVARRYLVWAKHLAPRSPAVREALGIALYREGDLHGALAELQAYRRLSGGTDQNHLIADCIRSEGRDVDRAVVVGMELVDDERAEIERRVEAAIVVAAVHLDTHRAARARPLIQRFLVGPEAAAVPSESTVRLLWVAADVAVAEGRSEDALRALERLSAIEPDYPDVADRIAQIRAG
jgi:predicted Zn-dependent protease